MPTRFPTLPVALRCHVSAQKERYITLKVAMEHGALHAQVGFGKKGVSCEFLESQGGPLEKTRCTAPASAA